MTDQPPKFKELARVKAIRDLKPTPVPAGSLGVIVYAWPDITDIYEVEFDGHKVTCHEDDLEAV